VQSILAHSLINIFASAILYLIESYKKEIKKSIHQRRRFSIAFVALSTVVIQTVN